MNRRQRWMMQAVLAIVAGLLGWRLATEWKQADLRYEALESPAESRPAAVPAAEPEKPLAVEQIAANNLFSADRNNALPEPETTETALPPPPKPTVLGTMNLGEHYEALMSPGDAAEGGVRRVKQGEQVGGYQVVEIHDAEVVIEYEGRTTKLDVYQSRQSVTQQRTRTAAPPKAAAPAVVSTGAAPARRTAPARAAAPNQPRQPSGREIKPPGLAPYTRVFIEGNRRRVERTTPFGIQKWYEPLQPGDKE